MMHIQDYRAGFLKIIGITTLLSLLACALIDPVWGYYESFMALMVSGSINGVFITENYHMGMSPMTQLQALLHRHFTTIPWTGILMLIGWIIIQTLTIYLALAQGGPGNFKLKRIVAAWLLLMVMIFGVSFIEFSITGVSMLLACMSLLGIWHVYQHVQAPALRWSFSLLLSFLVFSAYAMRIESGLGGTLIAVVFIIITELHFLRLIKAFWLPAIAIVIFFVRFYHVMNSHPFFRDVEPLVFYVTDSHNPPPRANVTDSTEALIREMARASFMIDSAIFNYALFRKIADEKLAYEKELFTLRPSAIIHQIGKEAGPTLKRNTSMLLIYGLMLAGMFALFSRQNKRKAIIQGAAFNAVMWAIISFLAYSLKMEQWHFVPLMQLTMIGNLLFSISHLAEGVILANKPRLRIAVVIISIISIAHLATQIRTNRAMINERVAAANDIFDKQNGRLLFFDTTSRETLDNYVFRLYKLRKGVYFYDMAQMPYLPEYEKSLNELCRCNSHSVREFFDFMKSKSEHIRYYSVPERIELLEAFLNRIHGMNVTFQRVEEMVLEKGGRGILQVSLYQLDFRKEEKKVVPLIPK